MSELTQTQLTALVTAYGAAAARAARAPRNTSAARCAFEVENAACASLLAAIGSLVADREKLAAWKAAVEAQEPADVQVRVNNPLATWQRPDTTRDEPTPLARAHYLCSNWPKRYTMRLLYTLPAAPEVQS